MTHPPVHFSSHHWGTRKKLKQHLIFFDQLRAHVALCMLNYTFDGSAHNRGVWGLILYNQRNCVKWDCNILSLLDRRMLTVLIQVYILYILKTVRVIGSLLIKSSFFLTCPVKKPHKTEMMKSKLSLRKGCRCRQVEASLLFCLLMSFLLSTFCAQNHLSSNSSSILLFLLLPPANKYPVKQNVK